MATNGVARERTSSEIEEMDKNNLGGLGLSQTKSIGGMTISPELFEKVSLPKLGWQACSC
jgi:hypothetical protein